MIKYTVQLGDTFRDIAPKLGFKAPSSPANYRLFAEQIEIEGFSRPFDMNLMRPGDTLINMKGYFNGKENNKQK